MSALIEHLTDQANAEAARPVAPLPAYPPTQRVEDFRVVTRHRLGRQLDPRETPLPGSPETLNYPIDWTDGEIDLAMPAPHVLLFRVPCSRCATGYYGAEAWNAATILAALVEGLCPVCQREILEQHGRAVVARALANVGGAS